MNVLFITMATFSGISEHSVYPDLIRCFSNNGHQIYVLLPNEERNNKNTYNEEAGNAHIIYVRTGNLFNVNMVTKLKSRAGVAKRFIHVIKNMLNDVKFDLILYSTPPTTFYKVVSYVKKRDNAYSYLMLKDIFPQNAVDLGMIRQNGLIYKILRLWEKMLYRVSDTIGCMSPANKEYLLMHNPWINIETVELCPNALEQTPCNFGDKRLIREQYGIPTNKTIFIYGGGLGKPQGIDFLLSCIEKIGDNSGCFFMICGDGVYYESIKERESKYPQRVKIIKWLPVNEYNRIVYASDVGLIFLNHNFKIPNYPSRILLYMECSLPILAATDTSTDIGRIAKENGYGDWCESIKGNEETFIQIMEQFRDVKKRMEFGKNAKEYFETNYTVDNVYRDIQKHLNKI